MIMCLEHFTIIWISSAVRLVLPVVASPLKLLKEYISLYFIRSIGMTYKFLQVCYLTFIQLFIFLNSSFFLYIRLLYFSDSHHILKIPKFVASFSFHLLYRHQAPRLVASSHGVGSTTLPTRNQPTRHSQVANPPRYGKLSRDSCQVRIARLSYTTECVPAS